MSVKCLSTWHGRKYCVECSGGPAVAVPSALWDGRGWQAWMQRSLQAYFGIWGVGAAYLSIYLSIYLYLSVYLSNYLSIYLPFYYLSIDRPIYLSTNIQMAHSHPSQPHLESFGLGTMTFE